jgi:hypothetical protein
MSKVLILAAVAAVSLACHNRAEDEVGAAPEQTDTTAVTHVIDSTRTGPPGVGGRPGDATITPDSVGVDSALTNQENGDTLATPDTTTSWTSTPQDTLGPADTGVEDSTEVQGDSTMTNHAVPDTAAAQ